MIRFQLPLMAVADVTRSKHFYCTLFDQTIVADFGRNVTFSGGFAIQEDFAWLTGVSPQAIVHPSNNMELYFEVDDLDAWMRRLRAYGHVSLLHPPMTHPWRQRVVRLYDPDGHLIEVGEAMQVVVRRLLAQGYTVEQTAALTEHPVSFVQSCLEEQ